MTLIIGVESPEENCAYVMADSGAWMSNVREVLMTPKIWRCGDWVVGAAGELMQVQIARGIKLPDVLNTEEIGIELMLAQWHRRVIAEVSAYTRDLVAICGSNGESQNIPGFICARRGLVFAVNGGAASRCTRGWDSCGILRQYAQGAMRALALRTKNPFDHARETMQCAYADSDYVWGPVRWMSTKAETMGTFDATTVQMLNQLYSPAA